MTNQALNQLCLNRIKSSDFGQPKRQSRTKAFLGFCLFAMLTIAYLIVGETA